jgi:hypothetical protein
VDRRGHVPRRVGIVTWRDGRVVSLLGKAGNGQTDDCGNQDG